MIPTILEATDIRKRYGATTALDGVSLGVGRTEILGLLGPNGAGKTTLLSIMAGLLDADTGSVTIHGQRFDRRDRDLRRKIGLGTQDLAIYPELTARENLTFFGRLYEIESTRLAKRVDELLEEVGLTDRANDRAGTFSGGMKRRLNLAVAVVHEPEILFLDEPTTGVDPQSRNHIYRLIQVLSGTGMAIVYTSHYIQEVQDLCERIAILDRGRILACDRVDQLLKMRNRFIQVRGVGIPHEMRTLPGVKQAIAITGGFQFFTESPSRLLPSLMEIWQKQGEDMSDFDISIHEPSLEEVFLHLTGYELRD